MVAWLHKRVAQFMYVVQRTHITHRTGEQVNFNFRMREGAAAQVPEQVVFEPNNFTADTNKKKKESRV